MGFGLLFIGYFVATLMTMNAAGAFIRMLGCSIILIASTKLSKYNRSFMYLTLSSAAMIIISAFVAAADVTSFLYEQLLINTNPLSGAYANICSYINFAVSFVFNTALLYAIKCIATETQVHKNAVSAIRNWVFICIYYILAILSLLPFEFAKYLNLPAIIIYLIWIVLNLILIYSCYARICDESDIEMAQKPSRFAFVNKMRAESERRQAEAAAKRMEYKSQKTKNRREK